MADEAASSMSSSKDSAHFTDNSNHQPRRWGAYHNRRPYIERHISASQYYCYPESFAPYSGVPQYVPQGAVYATYNQWISPNLLPSQLPYQVNLSDTLKVSKPTEVNISFSKFSPDAPEFVMKESIPTCTVEPEVKKKKKNRRKKKPKIKETEAKTEEVIECKDEDLDCTKPSSSVISETEKPTLKPKKNVRFQVSEKPASSERANSTEKQALTLNDSESVKDVDKEDWPQLKTNSVVQPSNSVVKKVATFAEKLKAVNGSSQIHPFLDWRDQRTGAANQPLKEPIESFKKSETNLKTEELKNEVQETDGDWVEVRKKKRGKPEEPVLVQCEGNVQIENSKATTEDEAKKAKDKERKEKKKARTKEKKKQLREEKLLAQKLAPKGQKVTFITPQVMAKFLQANSGLKSKPIQPVPVVKSLAFDDKLFPALGKPVPSSKTVSSISDSESEWETTEVEIVRAKTQQAPPAHPTSVPGTTKNIKRSDPVQWDLMSLISKQQNSKKISGQHKVEAKRKTRSKVAGVVANPLDRNAPILVRGKIRNKKRKLSDIRKALLAAKAKKKETLASQAAKIENSEKSLAKGPTQPKLHSNKFREYCDQILTDDIDILSRDMLFHLRHFQDRAFHKDPIKGRMRKRLIAGLREVTKQVERNRVKIIFLAPDIQRCPETGGLDQAVEHLLESARKAQLPIVYALSRRKIGRVLKKNVPVSCCGVLNYQGTEEIWNKLSELSLKAKDDYQLKAQLLGLKQAVTVQTVEDSKELMPEVEENPPRGGSETDALLQLMKLSLKN